MFCPYCGASAPEDVSFCPQCGNKIADSLNAEQLDKITANSAEKSTVNNLTNIPQENIPKENTPQENASVNRQMCKYCGSYVENGETYCIKCGKPVYENPNNFTADRVETTVSNSQPDRKSKIQELLCDAYKSNAIFKFILEYSIVFTLFYPIYILMHKIEALSSVVEILNYGDMAFYYLYYISLVAAWSKIIRLAILITAFVFVLKDLQKTNQYTGFTNGTKNRNCPVCGNVINQNDYFCPRCGNRTEGNL